MNKSMTDLSLPQEFFLLTLKPNGKFPSATSYEFGALLASVLIEFSQSEVLEIKEKKINMTAQTIPHDLEYLVSTYQILDELKKKTTTNFANKYFTFSDKNYKVLVTSIADSLINIDCIKKEQVKGLLGDKTVYRASSDHKDRIIQRLRTELLEDGAITAKTVSLVCILNRLKKLEQYFSKYESATLKNRIKELKKSQENQVIKDILDLIDSIMTLFIVAATT